MSERIACQGWGSLIWDKQCLPVNEREWQTDGPHLPVEFGRQSSRNRVTLVLVEGLPSVDVLWNVMLVSNLGEAAEALREREGTVPKNIGTWFRGSASRENAIGEWAKERNLTGVVWTALEPRFSKQDRMPALNEVIEHLQNLKASGLSANAEEYVRKAPLQIRAPYRHEIERQLGWFPSA